MRKTHTRLWLVIAAGLIGGPCTTPWLSAAEPAPVSAVAADPYQQLPTLDFGAGSDVLTAINKECVDAKPDQYPAIEKKLIQVLQNKSATVLGRQYACRMLKIVGSPQCVPALATLLGDDKLSHMARYALQGLKSPDADAALRDALSKTGGKVRVGIINTLGDRRDGQAVPLLAKLLAGQDDLTTVTAMRSLGRIGTPQAAEALQQAKVSDALAGDCYEARLLCGQAMTHDGKLADARAVFTQLNQPQCPAFIRGAALTGLVRVDGDPMLPAVIDALKSNEKLICQAASASVIELRSPAASAAFAQALPGLPPQAKFALLHALAARAIPQGLTAAINSLVSDPDPTVAAAALAALRPLGDASSVPVVAAALKNKDLAADATLTLKMVFADGLADQLMKLAQTGDTDTRAAIIGILGDRRETAALPLVLKLCADQDKTIRMAAIKSAGALGTDKDVEPLLAMLLKTTDGGEQGALEKAISAIALRNKDVEARPEPVIKALASANAALQPRLLNILATLGGRKSLDAVRNALASNVPDVKRAALRSLTDWTDDAPMNDLKKLAKEDPDQATRTLALRGFVRMIGLPRNRRANQAVTLYKEAMDLCTRPEEKRQVLGGLANVKDLAALKLVQGCFADQGLRREAIMAAAKIGSNINGRNAKEARAILEEVQKSLTDKDGDLKKRVQESLDKLAK